MPRVVVGLAALAFFAVPATAAAPAEAATSLKKGIWGPVRVNGVPQFPIYRRLGAGVWSGRLVWSSVASTRPVHSRMPTDPAYVWPAQLDDAIAQGRRYGQRIAVEVSGSPPWANGGRPARWAPRRVRDFA